MLPIVLVAAALVPAACSEGDDVVVRVVSQLNGAPLAAVRVRVMEQPWVTTGVDGIATFEAVPEPFTVQLHASTESNHVYYLLRRTGTDVTAEVSEGPHQFLGAQVSGPVTGLTGPPSTASLRVGVAPFEDWSTSFQLDERDSFDLVIPWRGVSNQSPTRLRLHAWEADGTDPPGHYYGFGRSAAIESVRSGDVITGVSLPLRPVTERAVDGSLSLLEAHSSTAWADLDLDFGRYEKLRIAQQEVTPGTFAFVVPTVEGAEPWIRVSTRGGWHHRRVVASATRFAFTPPAPPELLEPAASTPIGDTTVFRWRPAESGGSSRVQVSCNWTDDVSGYAIISYRIEAEGNETTLPDFSGPTVAPGAECTVVVTWCSTTDPAVEERCSQTSLDAPWQ